MRSSIEEEVEKEVGEELTDEQQTMLNKEKRELQTRFSRAWLPPVHTVILDFSVISYVDTVAVKVLSQVWDYLELFCSSITPWLPPVNTVILDFSVIRYVETMAVKVLSQVWDPLLFLGYIPYIQSFWTSLSSVMLKLWQQMSCRRYEMLFYSLITWYLPYNQWFWTLLSLATLLR